jgi:hypothetical protein
MGKTDAALGATIPGDKVRLKTGDHAGERALVVAVQHGTLVLDLGGRRVRCPVSGVTNFSLAARKAWATMPKRAGRPRAPVPRTKMLSLRLPVDLLEQVDDAVGAGHAETRSEFIERALRAAVTRASAPRPKLRLVRTSQGSI